jgi:hypothetical protein
MYNFDLPFDNLFLSNFSTTNILSLDFFLGIRPILLFLQFLIFINKYYAYLHSKN